MQIKTKLSVFENDLVINPDFVENLFDFLRVFGKRKIVLLMPLVFTFGDDKFAGGTVIAYGAKTPFKTNLPNKPTKIDFDPNRWMLSERTSARQS